MRTTAKDLPGVALTSGLGASGGSGNCDGGGDGRGIGGGSKACDGREDDEAGELHIEGLCEGVVETIALALTEEK